ncbi:hypothetical protein J7T55_000733 [Diaporthe amygdali]|uniref:uncharacterized protein n=1 Tax=Phomopsis amygdali TaxID=1214568 RepID=UPI0022FE5874|nr:uncharacterized protein J7T55_000733 [Diaporthe amygdali]KAJ0110300.1 hypothetical protein J7T55_000733 [Diaporthe amygdali]
MSDQSLRRKPRSTGYTRQRQGCLTCRRRKKKCDRSYPFCGHCSRLNLVCERESPRPLHPDSGVEKAAHRAPGSGPDTGTLLFPYLKTQDTLDNALGRSDSASSRRAMLRYYTTSFAAMLSTNHENNCFLSVLLPMAFESSTLMYTLTAWASTHLSQIEPRFRDIALQHRGTALRCLKADLDEMSISHEMWLAVTMASCSMESISDGTQNWYEHLVGGAIALGVPIGSNTPPSKDHSEFSTTEGKWLLRNFAYHDILMSVSMDCRPLLLGDYWLDQNEQKADPYFGLAARILRLIGQISCLNADFTDATMANSAVSEEISHKSTNAQFSETAKAIEAELIQWIYPDEYRGSTLAQLAETYRDAAFLHLYRTLRRHLRGFEPVLNGKIRKNVESICARVRDMPTGCLPECTLLFPLFMAGGEAEELSQIATIREKMRSINERRRFRNVEVCLQVLDELWRLRISGTGSMEGARLDWLDVVRSRGYKLALT